MTAREIRKIKFQACVETYSRGSRKLLYQVLVGMGLLRSTAQTIVKRTNRRTAAALLFSLREQVALAADAAKAAYAKGRQDGVAEAVRPSDN